jgi:hypothetical protein
MCRSIKVLRNPGQRATAEELNLAALQYVRKISGLRKPSKASQEAFDRAVQEIAMSSGRLLTILGERPHKPRTESQSVSGSAPESAPESALTR